MTITADHSRENAAPGPDAYLVERLWKDRRWLHACAEIGFQERETAAYVQQRLRALGVPFQDGLAETGLVAEIRGRGAGTRAIGLRADLDALPIEEGNTFAHRSRNAGVFHGCGHDGHTTIMLGVAEVLARSRDFDGIVRLIFQPAEEGGLNGAKRMLDEGLLKRFPMEQVFALHNWPELPVGTIGTCRGPILASGHLVSIRLRGQGGHGGTPHQSTPLMTVLAHVILGLNDYIAVRKPTQQQAVLSLTKVHASDMETVLPSEILVEGSARILDPEMASEMVKEVPELVRKLADAWGAQAEVVFREVVPSTVNDPAATEVVRRAAARLGLIQATEDTGLKPIMGSEDFSFTLQAVPGCYFLLGQGGIAEGKMLHAPNYDFNDDVIATGVSMFHEIVRQALPLGC